MRTVTTELVVSGSMLKESIREATDVSNQVFTGTYTAVIDGKSEEVALYAANIVEGCIDRHVVVEGRTSAGLRAALKHFSAPVQVPGKPLLTTVRAVRQIRKAVQMRGRVKGNFCAMDHKLPGGAKGVVPEDEMLEDLRSITPPPIKYRAIYKEEHPAFVPPGSQGWVSMMASASKDLVSGSLVAAYTDGATIFLNDDDDKEAGGPTSSLRDNEFVQPPLGDAKDRSICINGNPIRNAAVRINDYRGTGQVANCRFISYLRVPSDADTQPELVVVLVMTRSISKGEELLTDYGDKYWASRSALEGEREQIRQWLRQRYSAFKSGEPMPMPPTCLICDDPSSGTSEPNVRVEEEEETEEEADGWRAGRKQRKSAREAGQRIKRIQMMSEDDLITGVAVILLGGEPIGGGGDWVVERYRVIAFCCIVLY